MISRAAEIHLVGSRDVFCCEQDELASELRALQDISQRERDITKDRTNLNKQTNRQTNKRTNTSTTTSTSRRAATKTRTTARTTTATTTTTTTTTTTATKDTPLLRDDLHRKLTFRGHRADVFERVLFKVADVWIFSDRD